MNKNANIIEIFTSIQGEGLYIGCRQIFIRFAGCNLSCNYCDTPFQAQEFCNLHEKEGSKKLKNPVSSEQLLEEIADLNKIHHHSLSLTGGEPLLHTDFLAKFLPVFRKNFPKTRVYLETNGTLFTELKKIIEHIDIISMDLKLKSSTGVDFPFEQHKKFIETAVDCHVGLSSPTWLLASNGITGGQSPPSSLSSQSAPRNDNVKIFAKAVITNEISDEEIDELTDFIKIPLVLQPVSSNNKKLLLSPQNIIEIQEKFLKKLNDVKVIPQVHKFLDLL